MATTTRGGKSSNAGNGGRARTSGQRKSGTTRSSRSSSTRSDSSGGFLAAVKSRPLASAAIAAGAAGASAFLWAKRAQLSDQISDLTDAVSERFGSDNETSNELENMSSASSRKSRGGSTLDETSDEMTKAGALSY